jgi:hypothetical protein
MEFCGTNFLYGCHKPSFMLRFKKQIVFPLPSTLQLYLLFRSEAYQLDKNGKLTIAFLELSGVCIFLKQVVDRARSQCLL